MELLGRVLGDCGCDCACDCCLRPPGAQLSTHMQRVVSEMLEVDKGTLVMKSWEAFYKKYNISTDEQLKGLRFDKYLEVFQTMALDQRFKLSKVNQRIAAEMEVTTTVLIQIRLITFDTIIVQW